jgi:YD repeat-containing protein
MSEACIAVADVGGKELYEPPNGGIAAGKDRSGQGANRGRIRTGGGVTSSVRIIGNLPDIPTFGWNLRLTNGTVLAFPNFIGVSDPALAALLSITDRYGNKVTLTRDLVGNLLQVASPNGRWISFTHLQNTGPSSPITQAQDDTGRIVTYSYSLQSPAQLIQVSDTAGNLVTYVYNPADATEMVSILDKNNNLMVTNQYDSSERISKQTLSDGSIYQVAYGVNAQGQATTDVTDPRGVKRHLSYNFHGYVLTDTEAVGLPEQQTTTYQRDPNTNAVQSITDQLGRQTVFTGDSKGNITSITRLAGTPNAVTTNYTYELTFSQLTSITDPLNHTWTLGRDSSGNLTSITDPNNNTTTLTYNAAGQPLTVTDPLNDITKFSYNSGLLSAATDPLGNTSSFSYDGAGRLITATDPLDNSTSIAYDLLDRTTSITDAKGGVTSFTYDANGNLLSLTDAKGNKTSYAYDSRNRRISRTDALGNKETYAYDGMSNVTSLTDRRGVVTTYTYDGLNRRAFAGFGTGGNAVQGTAYRSTINYTWDGGNRLTQAADSIAGTITRSYDGLDRVTQEQTPQGIVGYTYDNASRRAMMTVSGQAQTSYMWDNSNRLYRHCAGLRQRRLQLRQREPFACNENVYPRIVARDSAQAKGYPFPRPLSFFMVLW